MKKNTESIILGDICAIKNNLYTKIARAPKALPEEKRLKTLAWRMSKEGCHLG